MINQVYQLVSPRHFAVSYDEININDKNILVRPTHLSICAADQRYYSGTRDPKVIAKKLPMALIHESSGEIVYDPTNNFKSGDKVILIPNTPVEADEYIAENYLRSSKFRASGFDGFMQDYMLMRPDRIVKLPDDMNMLVASFSELVSVSVHTLTRLEKLSHPRKTVFGVWGDGNLGYITCLLLKYKFPNSKIYIFGKSVEKLDYFTFVDDKYLIDDIPNGLSVDHAIECVGGIGSQYAINQIIDLINPEGSISIMGVSEQNVEINTRMILEKGLRIIGNSRSGRSDFVETAKLYQEHPEIVIYLENLIGHIMPIRTIENINTAFEEDLHRNWGKTVLIWDK